MMKEVCFSFLAIFGLSVASFAFQEEEPSSSEQYHSSCGAASDWVRPKDFRLRGSTPQLRFSFEDGKVNHLDPAMSAMDQGRYDSFAIRNIDFLLQRWPNHYLALQALMRFESGGGQTFPSKPAICYFEYARQFVPKDANIWILQGIYFHKKENPGEAEMAWRNALEIDATLADAHYNLGLLYFDQGKYQEARTHAGAAYGAGYPLRGLKNKLVRAGQWSN